LDPKNTPHFSLEDRDKWLNDAALSCFFQHINNPQMPSISSGVESLAWESLEPEIISGAPTTQLQSFQVDKESMAVMERFLQLFPSDDDDIYEALHIVD
jgi:hypothetical protein